MTGEFMYRNIKEYKIKYTDTDAFDNLKYSALLSYMEESACDSADELGFGYVEIAPKNIGFVILNWYTELFRPVKLGENLRIATWPLKPKFGIFFRDFELYCGNEKVGVCTSRWCMVDLKTFAVLPTSAFFSDSDFTNYNTERSVIFNNWKIPLVDSHEPDAVRKIYLSDYDHYFHVNNTKYADFLLDSFSVGEIKGKFFKKIQVTYVKQCKIGEKLELFRVCSEDVYIVEGRVDGELRVQFRVELNEI